MDRNVEQKVEPRQEFEQKQEAELKQEFEQKQEAELKQESEQKQESKQSEKTSKSLLIAALIVGIGLTLIFSVPAFKYASGLFLVLASLSFLAGVILLFAHFIRLGRLGGFTAGAIISSGVAVILAILAIVFHGIDGWFYLVLGIVLAVDLIFLLLLFLKKKGISRPAWIDRIKVPVIALAFDLSSVLLYYLGVLTHSITPFLIAVIVPLVGIVMGISSLCMGKDEIGKGGKAIAITAIALPILFVITMIILFSTGVMRISFM